MVGLYQDVLRTVFELDWLSGERPLARAVPVQGRLEPGRCVWPKMVVALPPLIERFLGLIQVAKRAASQDFSLQGPVKTLILAIGLRVPGAAEAQVDAQLH